MKKVKEILKEHYIIIECARQLLESIPSVEYKFSLHEDFEKVMRTDISKASRIYWYEILLRSHMASCSGLKRLLDWFGSLESSEENYIQYCSSLRGLMECTGDTYHGLASIAVSLADNNKEIKKALLGKTTIDSFAISSELENRIIHFTHASKSFSKQTSRAEHKPERSSEYVKILEVGSSLEFYSLYGELCEVVHPAGNSLGYNFVGKDDYFFWDGKRDSEVVEISLESHREIIIELLMRGFNPIFLLFKTLNLFDEKGLQTLEANRISLDQLKIWKEIEDKFK